MPCTSSVRTGEEPAAPSGSSVSAGVGANAVDAMIRAGLKGVEYVTVNTDFRALNRSSARTKIAIGRSTTFGLGAGGDVAVGDSAAREAAEAIGQALTGSDLVVIVAALGGGTGSGAGRRRRDRPRTGRADRGCRDHSIRFRRIAPRTHRAGCRGRPGGPGGCRRDRSSDQVRGVMPADVTVEDAFSAIDDAVHRSVAEIVDLVAVPGRVNLDFADVRAVLRGGGAAAVGLGRAAGENRATEATRRAMASTIAGRSPKGRVPRTST